MGHLLIDKSDTSKYIFLPNSGYKYESSFSSESEAHELSSVIYDSSAKGYTYILEVESSSARTSNLKRACGCTVRGVHA